MRLVAMTAFGRLLRRLGGATFVVVGVLQLVWCIRVSAEAVKTTHWPTALGTIQSAEVLEVKGGRGTGYVPKVTYTYEVAGVRYKGDRIHIDDVSESRNQAHLTIAPFAAGTSVRVYFDHEKPSQSLLVPGLYWYSTVWFGLAVMGIVVGTALCYFNRTERAD